MNYVLIMTEGSDELSFINVLIDRGILKFNKEQLLMEEIYHARQITGQLIGNIQSLPIGDTVNIYRIGDKLSDKLKIPKEILPEKINCKYDISTTPEFEILFLLNENLYDDYMKVKSFKKPSEYYKEYNRKYKKQASFVKEYFNSMTNEEIINLINLYVKKHGKSHKDNQLTLKEIINC